MDGGSLMRIAACTLIAALWAGAAAANDQPMSTAGGGAPPVASETAAQIEQWIADSPAARTAPDEEALADAPRKIHGEVSVAVGTGGYRSGHVVTHIPLGENGTATVAFGKTDYGDRMYPVWIGPGLGAPLH